MSTPEKKPDDVQEYKTSKLAMVLLALGFIGFFAAMVLVDKYFLNP